MKRALIFLLLAPMMSAQWLPLLAKKVTAAASTENDVLIFRMLASGATGTDTTGGTYSTSSITPTANALVILDIATTKASASDDISSITAQAGLSWAKEATTTFNTIANGLIRISRWRGMGTTPTASVVTVNFASSGNQTGLVYYLYEFINAETSGSSGSGAMVQSVTNRADSTTNPTATYTTPGSTSNATVFFTSDPTNATDSSVPQAWWEWSELGHSSPTQGGMLAIRMIPPAATSVTATVASRDWGAIFSEVKPLSNKATTVNVATFFSDLNGQTDTTDLTATIAANGSYGTGLGSLTVPTGGGPSTELKVNASIATRTRDVRVTVPGSTTTIYTPTGATTHGYKVNMSNGNTRYVQGVLDSNGNRRTCSVGFFFQVNTSGRNNAQFNLVELDNSAGHFACFQLRTGAGAAFAINVETDNDSFSAQHSNDVSITEGTIYWGTMQWNMADSTAVAKIYSSDGTTLIGTCTATTFATIAAGDYINTVRWGNVEFGTETGNYILESLIVNTTGTFPILP